MREPGARGCSPKDKYTGRVWLSGCHYCASMMQQNGRVQCLLQMNTHIRWRSLWDDEYAQMMKKSLLKTQITLLFVFHASSTRISISVSGILY